MPPAAFVDLRAIDLEHVVCARDEILSMNPQRYEFALLDAIVYMNVQDGLFVGYYDLRPDDWWVRGHIPQRPLFPGVLMIEVAAQMCSFLTHKVLGDTRFTGFAGVDAVKFRGTVSPPARFYIVGRAKEVKKKRTVCETQGFVNGTMIFEAVITGMPI